LLDFRSGIGSYYGTLSGPITALSPQVKPSKEYKSPGKNFYTNPGKKGTGYGYVDVNAVCSLDHSMLSYDERVLDLLAKVIGIEAVTGL